MQDHLASDIHYLRRGLEMITEPGIRRFVFIPLTINFLLISAGFYYALLWIKSLKEEIASWVPDWAWAQELYASVEWLIYPLLFISVLIVILYFFALLANWIGAPFNGLLSEAVERKVTGEGPEGLSYWQMFKDLPRLIGREFRKLGYYLPRAIGILLLFLVPLVNFVAPFLWFIFNAWMMNLSYVDYPMDNHRIRFRDTLNMVRSRRHASLGYGSILMGLYMIPLVNVLIMPVAVAGSTILWCERYRGT